MEQGGIASGSATGSPTCAGGRPRTLLLRPLRALLVAGLVLAGVLWVGWTRTPPALADGFTNTSNGIHLGLAYDYNTTSSSVASEVDYVFGGYFLDWNFGFYPRVPNVDGYIPMDVDPNQQTVPGNTLAWFQANHPDWVVYRCDGRTPAYYGSGDTNVPLDFSNPAVQRWQVQQAGKLFAMGATGVVFDNVTFANFESRCGVYRNGTWTTLGYPGTWEDNARYSSDVLTWLKNVSTMIRQQYPGKTVGVNFAPHVSGLANLEAIAPYVDMVFDEAGFTDYGDGNLAGSAWQQEVNAFEYLNSQGKAFEVNGIANADADPNVTHDQLNWILANYLMVKGSHSYTYVYSGIGAGYTGSPSGYGTFYDRPEYHIPIGSPTSAIYSSQNVEMRSYSGGLVIVNPSSSSTDTISLSGSYTDMWGVAHSSVVLPPTSAIVLLGSGAQGPAAKASAAQQSPRAKARSKRHQRNKRRHRRHRRHHRAHRQRQGHAA